jgi:hypothetical protein
MMISDKVGLEWRNSDIGKGTGAISIHDYAFLARGNPRRLEPWAIKDNIHDRSTSAAVIDS